MSVMCVEAQYLPLPLGSSLQFLRLGLCLRVSTVVKGHHDHGLVGGIESLWRWVLRSHICFKPHPLSWISTSCCL